MTNRNVFVVFLQSQTTRQRRRRGERENEEMSDEIWG